MSPGASIIHLNVVSFMAAVEALRDPGLRGQPFAVGIPGAARGRILEVSRLALREGVAPGMPIGEAERRLPGLRLVRPSPEAYRRANREMETICARYAPLLENSGGGHFFLDLRGTRRLFGEYIDQAVHIRREIAEGVGLDATTALAGNKLVAKVGTRSLRPAGFVAVREGDEEAFLCHQDVRFLPGVGPSIGRILSVTGIGEIGELAAFSDNEITGLLGRRGPELRASALGIDGSKVEQGDLTKRSIASRLHFDNDVLDEASILAALVTLVEGCGLELRRSRLQSRVVAVELGYSDNVAGRSATRLPRPIALDDELLAAARMALSRAHDRRVRVASLALALGALEPASLQLDLFAPVPALRETFRDREPRYASAKLDRLQAAVDAARERFGAGAVTRCAALNAEAWHDV
jgi:DNA polymerase-4